MSVSKWAYTPEKCDGQPCPGDCDHCARQSLYEMKEFFDGIGLKDATGLMDAIVPNPNRGKEKRMVECIDRDELIGDIQYTFDGLAESWVQASELIIDIIREAPEVPQKEYTEQQIRDTFNCGYSCGMHNEWITDELPIDGQEVIATVHWMDYGDTITAYGHYNARFDTWSLYSDVEGKLNKGFEVIAWIPVLETYREESEDKE